MPQNVASDLGLHCLPMSLLWDVKLKKVKLHKWSMLGKNPSIPTLHKQTVKVQTSPIDITWNDIFCMGFYFK